MLTRVPGRSKGTRLIGRVPSHPAQEMEAHAIKYGTGLRSSPTGDVSCDDFQLELGTQRAGDHIISSALFFVAGDDHSVTIESSVAV